ncbi:hypothetical protein HPB52_008633 [Rhipicephalus sanguineus]|uniref:RING-type domain-containing protein n=1 Tax=Rhipicephalus sanguineus TaxID=34632 RepID=A0A9D4T5F0_RHISA|nr:hypothetical protein HPB52_008633 [Rhipicephalus sanguineus]
MPFEYVLTGFDDFLERRRVAFVERLPATRVCCACGLVSSQSLLLPCGHVLCRICKGQNVKEVKCPFDSRVFADTEVICLNLKQSDLEQFRVRCITGGEHCSFAGKLSELKRHLTHCSQDEVKCCTCGQTLVRSVAVHHYQQCSGGIVVGRVVSGEEVKSIVGGLGEIKANLEKLRLRGAEGEQLDKHSVVNVANCLFERVVSLEQELLRADETANYAQDARAIQATRQVPISHGPFRAASRPDAFIVLRTFTDVPAVYDRAKATTNEVVIATEVCVLAGYSFKLECKLAKDQRDEVHLWFVLSICSGPWDSLLEWPFTKKVTVVLTHPRFLRGDVRLPMHMEDHGVVKKPTSSAPNMGSCTEKVSWMAVELNGFIDNKNLYANVEFQ